ncbi:MAG TPA: hypothetical protein DCZ92_04185 [Elusimicrobia bacterium]|nr:MAG: hypothetical protein A2016_07890 [Elusimicrobia bacterium GWF2_62_30]HBA60014.1 hypothetical protein [Elusimicrobiota bacterium]
MRKSKTFWAVAALLSLCLLLFSGYSLYGRISLYLSGDTLDISSVAHTPPPVPRSEDEEEAPKEAAAAPEQAEAKKTEPEKNKALKTPFEYKDSKAKTVYLSGSFTAWKDVRMTKKEGVWKAEVYILPGTYPYHFTVDGVKKLDASKPKAPTGDSLIVVADVR